jgi:hypothetical protein
MQTLVPLSIDIWTIDTNYEKLIEIFLQAPIINVMIFVGLIFLLLAIVGNNRLVKPGKQGRKAAGVTGSALILIGLVMHVSGSGGDTSARQSKEFQEARPNPSGKPKVSTNDVYEMKAAGNDSAGHDSAQIGITVWKLEPAGGQGDGPRLLVQESDAVLEMAPQRVSADMTFAVGDRVFISIESPREGYLYVINREQLANGTMGDPYLICPSTKIRNGNNHVKAGLLTYIPAQNDRPNYFTLKPTGPGHIGEILSVVVLQQPIEGLVAGKLSLQLSDEQALRLEGGGEVTAQEFELKVGAKRGWTEEEKEAGDDDARLLTQEDPLPQTIYRVPVRQDKGIVAKLSLRYNVNH